VPCLTAPCGAARSAGGDPVAGEAALAELASAAGELAGLAAEGPAKAALAHLGAAAGRAAAPTTGTSASARADRGRAPGEGEPERTCGGQREGGRPAEERGGDAQAEAGPRAEDGAAAAGADGGGAAAAAGAPAPSAGRPHGGAQRDDSAPADAPRSGGEVGGAAGVRRAAGDGAPAARVLPSLPGAHPREEATEMALAASRNLSAEREASPRGASPRGAPPPADATEMGLAGSRNLSAGSLCSERGASPRAEGAGGADAARRKLASDKEIASSIKLTMNRLHTMSLPVALLAGAGSGDALQQARRAPAPSCRAVRLRRVWC